MFRKLNGITIAIISIAALCVGTASAEKPARQRPSQITPTGAEDAVQVGEDDGTRKVDSITSEATEGLTVVQRADGTQMVDLQGRFQHVLKANKSLDGKNDVSCNVDTKLVDASGKPVKAWIPKKGRGARLDIKPFKAPLPVAAKQAPALEVK
jgi:hypothetical protein